LALLKVGNRLLPKKYRSVSAHAVAHTMVLALRQAARGLQIVESDAMHLDA
jgi:hypothetical protein